MKTQNFFLFIVSLLFVLGCSNSKNEPTQNEVEKIVSECVQTFETKKEDYASDYLYYELESIKVDNIKKDESSTPNTYVIEFSGELKAKKETRTFINYADRMIKKSLISNEQILPAGDIIKIKGSVYLIQKNNNWAASQLTFKKE